MNYVSICSGIEAATVAWHPLGWKPALFAEVDKFPSRVLAHHYPEVRNVGDFTKITKEQCGSIDVLAGGTPCQDFSVAGLRAGLDGDRGQLTVEFAQLAGRLRPRWLVWENVPGVLSVDGGRAFGLFIGLLGQLGYRFAYRVLDAQYLGVPQRRRRVFLVGHLGDWRRAAAVLFERQSLSGDTPPRRETRQSVTGSLAARTQGGGGLGTDFDCSGGVIPLSGGIFDDAIAPALSASGRGTSRAGDSRGQDALIASTGEISHCLNGGGMGRLDFETETLITLGGFPSSDIAHSLRAEGFDASEDGTGRGIPLIAFDCKASGRNGFGVGEIMPTCRSMGHSESHQNGGGHLAIAIQERAVCENPNAGPDGSRIRDDGSSYTLEARTVPQAVMTPAMSVRRLTPRECERLQGFPDDYTLISPKTPDGPRYKALGNSMAVPVMRWIGERIAMVDAL